MRQSFAFLVLILLLCSFCNGHYVVSVEKDGKALNFSAKELSYYLGKITGRQVQDNLYHFFELLFLPRFPAGD